MRILYMANNLRDFSSLKKNYFPGYFRQNTIFSTSLKKKKSLGNNAKGSIFT